MAGRWNGQCALGPMCDAEKDWHERSFRASGEINGCQYFPTYKRPDLFRISPRLIELTQICGPLKKTYIRDLNGRIYGLNCIPCRNFETNGQPNS